MVLVGSEGGSCGSCVPCKLVSGGRSMASSTLVLERVFVHRLVLQSGISGGISVILMAAVLAIHRSNGKLHLAPRVLILNRTFTCLQHRTAWTRLR